MKAQDTKNIKISEGFQSCHRSAAVLFWGAESSMSALQLIFLTETVPQGLKISETGPVRV